MKKITALLLLCFLSVAFSFSQTLSNAQITYNKLTGVPEFIRFDKDRPLEIQGATLEEKSMNFLSDHVELFGIREVNTVFQLHSEKIDTQGFTHLEFVQLYQDIPVFDGLLKFHYNPEGKLTAVNGNVFPNIKLNPVASLSETQANAIAVAEIDRQDLNNSGVPVFVNTTKLYVFQKGLVQGIDEGRYLVFEVEVRNNLDVREFLYIDAYSGALVEQFTGMAHALNRIVYEGSATVSNIVWQEGDAFPGTLTNWQQNEVEASADIYYLFYNAFGFDSFDNAGSTMHTVNNSTSLGCPNASWNGYTTNYCDGTAADDAIAHEWGHAYTQYTNDLVYAYQAGAINESFSDIWGETVDLLNNYEDGDEDLSLRVFCGSSDRWVIGEDATSLGGGNGIRDMWNPTCYGNPGKMTDTEFYCGEGDSGGVHLNSGVSNHAYALLVDGGTYNSYSIVGLGFTKAAHIFWRAQSEYLTSTSDYYNLADALEASCMDLIGINLEGLSMSSTPAGLSGEVLSMADFGELQKVLLAVEMRTEPNCDYTTILAATADPCSAATANPIFYEDWESGMGSWTATEIPSEPGTWEPRNWTIETSLPDGRAGQGIFAPNPINGDCFSSLQNGILRLESPVINIPDYQTGTFEMMFAHNVATEQDWDGANIKYSLDGGAWTVLPASAFISNAYNGEINNLDDFGNDNPLEGEPAFTGADGGSLTGSWGRSYIDLSSIGVLPNSTLQLRWEMGTDGCNGRVGWYLDEISIYNCDFALSVRNTIKENVLVYPNPSNGVFTLSNPNRLDIVKAEVYDINGRLIAKVPVDNQELNSTFNLGTVRTGIYFLSLQTPTDKEVVKLVIR